MGTFFLVISLGNSAVPEPFSLFLTPSSGIIPPTAVRQHPSVPNLCSPRVSVQKLALSELWPGRVPSLLSPGCGLDVSPRCCLLAVGWRQAQSQPNAASPVAKRCQPHVSPTETTQT